MFSFLGQVVYAALAFGGSIVAARLLGAGGKGELTAWLLTAGIATFLLSATIPNGLGRAYLRGETRYIAGTAIQHTGLALLAAGLVAVSGTLLGIQALPLLLFVVVGGTTGVLTQDALMICMAGKRPVRFHLPRLIQNGVFTTALVALLALSLEPAQELAWFAFALGSVAGACLSLSFLRDAAPGWESSLSRIARLGHGSYLATLLDVVVLRADQYILLLVQGPVALGIYSVAVNWSEVGQYAGNAISHAVYEERDTLKHRAARRVFGLTALYVSVLMVPIVAGAFILIPIVFGQQFADARWAAIPLTVGIVARAVYSTGYQILMAQGQAPYLTRINGLVSIIGIGAWFTAAHLWGINGVAIAAGAVYFFQMALILGKFRTPRTPLPQGTRAPGPAVTRRVRRGEHVDESGSHD